MLVADNYAKVATMHIDPLEKKPLFHFRPGEEVMSLGGWGCNLGCQNCQNHSLSMVRDGGGPSRDIAAVDLMGICRREGVRNLAFTYNEPTIWHEYVMDIADMTEGLALIYVSNGFICPGPLDEVCDSIDAMNLDVKAFSDDFYRKVTKARLDPVLDTAETVAASDVHLELTYLLIPELNDDEDEMRDFCSWVAESLSDDVPVHFSAYHRDHRLTDHRDTSAADLLRARDHAYEAGLKHVYLGNLPTNEGKDTFCPRCGEVAISRKGYRTVTNGVLHGLCTVCGTDLNVRG